MARTYSFIIGAAEQGVRIDHFLSRRLPDIVSRTAIQRVIRAGAVTVNGCPVKANYKLRNKDALSAAIEELPPKSTGIEILPQAIALDVVYEDDALLVVNKPAGLVTHPAPGHWDGTLVNAVLWHMQQQAGRDPSHEAPLARAGIIHRLDKDTSGLLLVAKTDRSQLFLHRQMKARTIHRGYVAVVEGHLPLDTGTVNAAIGRHAILRKQMAIQRIGGRVAVTHYRVLQRSLKHATDAPPYSVLELTLDTGRTHQIRVHMAHAGHPVFGDTVYGKYSAHAWQQQGVARQLLHAYKLEFRHPFDQRLILLKAPIPEDIRRFCDPRMLQRQAL
jgi:23S rRNA pseudouridine1911/1915/1917 synthase